MKTSACHKEKPLGIFGGLDKSSTYKVGGRTFIVEPVFRLDAKETVGTILVNLMRKDASQV